MLYHVILHGSINCNNLEPYCRTKLDLAQKKPGLNRETKIEDILLIRFIKTTSKHNELEHEGSCARREENMKENLTSC